MSQTKNYKSKFSNRSSTFLKSLHIYRWHLMCRKNRPKRKCRAFRNSAKCASTTGLSKTKSPYTATENIVSKATYQRSDEDVFLSVGPEMRLLSASEICLVQSVVYFFSRKISLGPPQFATVVKLPRPPPSMSVSSGAFSFESSQSACGRAHFLPPLSDITINWQCL